MKVIHIEAVTVEHNASLFWELMLWSLSWCQAPSMAVTVVDYNSQGVKRF